MVLALLFQDPFLFLVWFLALLCALTVHEFSHALTAERLGDSTARDQGRLTLNPLAHIDLMGLLCLLLVGFGWGKPVPFNPYNLNPRFQKTGPGIIAAAGPFANLFTAIVCGILLRFLLILGFPLNNLLILFLSIIVLFNIALLFFNLLPCPPLDGSKILFSFLPERFENLRIFLESYGPFLLFGLIIFDRAFDFSFFEILFKTVFKIVQLILGFELTI